MAIHIGNGKIKKIYIGSSSGNGELSPRNVIRAYIGTADGNKLIYNAHEHVFEGDYHYYDESRCY
jgi:hypothetical protein